MRVLLVEDDPLIREFVVEALREEGYEVIHAANGDQAMAWCARGAADVLVTDVKLPGKMDGWQIAERYRERYPRPPRDLRNRLFTRVAPTRSGKRVFEQAIPPRRHRQGDQRTGALISGPNALCLAT